MNKYPLIGVCIIAVVLIVLGSLTNVVGYREIQASNQKVIINEVNQKELLFQTIVDIANNKEIQRIILKSQISRENFLYPDGRFSVFNTPVLTKNSLKHMYFVGLILSKIMSKSKIHSMIERYQISNQEVQKKINAVIEKDSKLNGEMTTLSNSKCDCENDNTTVWHFPVICLLLWPLVMLSILLYMGFGIVFLGDIVFGIGTALQCNW